MKTKLFLFFALLATLNSVKAQTLFTYGTHPVSKDEFLQAYYKNPDTTGNKQEKLNEYLDLYVNFRLKLQAAYDEKANTNADLKAEADNFKTQITDNFINQQANIGQLMHEAFVRSQKDILLQQVFISSVKGSDTTAAHAQIVKAYNELKAGRNFDEVATQYSTDSTTKTNKGTVGYITVFTLPYSIENIVYGLKPGEYSTVYKSSLGYHIFRNVSERPALGRRKIEQLLFPTPPFYSTEQISATAHVADSVYNLLQTGTYFSSLLPLYGHNYYDYQDANVLEVKVGDYSSDFENEVFSLKNKGDISRPFKTQYGYNIIKLNEIIPVSSDENDVTFAAWIQTQIQNDGRLEMAKSNLVENWLAQTGFKPSAYNHSDLWLYTDSALKSSNSLPALYRGIKPETVLFQFTKKKVTVKDWINYLHYLEIPANTTIGTDEYEKHMHDFTRFACSNYYKEHIEDFDTVATGQLKEFNDANMLFYVMDKHVWSKASEDTVGLRKYYDAHKSDYQWKESAAALVIAAPQKVTADSIAEKIKNNPLAWRDILAKYDNSVYADSNRFEADQLPVKQKVVMQKDFQTVPEPNDAGDSYTFVHILTVYQQPQQKTFEQARGLVINDYQQQLEKDWITNLKKTYPVKVNDTVLNSLH
ncbi:MAG: peptidylprolyl isomerase [Parafilimonas sp.]|nr:peptidylprolyl isomerase [Parafilimonas sp.]